MSPIVGYHATRQCCRRSIQEDGLIPFWNSYERPYGVYVYRDDGEFDHPGHNSRTIWGCHSAADLWQAAYIGPLCPDPYVINAMVFLGEVQHVTLVTGNCAG